MISKSFFKSSVIYTIGSALPLASSLVLLPFYAKALSISDFGMLDIYIGFTLLLQTIVNFSLDPFLATYFFEFKDDPYKLKKCIGTVFVSLLGIGILVSLILCVSGESIFSWVYKNKQVEFWPFGFLCVITAIFNSFFKTYSNLLVNEQKPLKFFIINFFNFSVTIILSLIFLDKFPHLITGPMLGRVGSGVLIFLLAALLLLLRSGFHFDKKLLKPMWKFSSPLMFYSLLVWVMGYIYPFIILKFMGSQATGIYSFAAKGIILIDFVHTGLYQAIYPKVFSIWKNQNVRKSTEEVNRYYNVFTAITILLIPLTFLILPVILPLVVKKIEYQEAFNYLPLMALSYAFVGIYNLYLAPVYFFKETKILPKIFLVSSAFLLVISFLLIKYFGLYGAIFAGMISKPLQAFFIQLWSRNIFTFKVNNWKLIYLPTIYCFLVIFGTFLFKPGMWLNLSLTAIAFMLTFIIYHKEIRGLIKKGI